MRKTKSIVMSFLGSFAAFIPFLGACPGAACAGCGGACVTPVVTILGVSLSGIFASELWDILQPVFIALSAVLFTIAYFAIYRKPKREAACNSAGCSLQNKPSQKQNLLVKVLFWVCLAFATAFFAYSLVQKVTYQKIPFNTSNMKTSEMKASYAFFDVDCLFWDKENKTLDCKGRVQPYATKVFELHDYATKNNIPVLFTTCCSAPMPDKNDMASKGMLYIPLDTADSLWKEKIFSTQTFYIAKNAYGNPKMNYDKGALYSFRQNGNLHILLDKMGITEWVVFGDAFESCTSQVIDGLLLKGYKVTILTDMISSGYTGNENQRKTILDRYTKKGVRLAVMEDIVKVKN